LSKSKTKQTKISKLYAVMGYTVYIKKSYINRQKY